MNEFNFIISLIVAGLLIIMGACEIILGIKLSKKYDKKFPKFVNEKDAFENGWWIISPILRGIRYAGCILFKNPKKRNFWKTLYDQKPKE